MHHCSSPMLCASQNGLSGTIPLDVLFSNPEKLLPQISPDGTQLAWCAPVNGVLNVWVRTLGQIDGRPVTSETSRGILNYSWTPDSKQILYHQDQHGDENFHLYQADLKSGLIRDLTPFSGVRVSSLIINKNFPNQVLVQVNFRGSSGYGKEFLAAGNLEWGREMHDDLIDAVQWAIDSGIADAKRVAIMGASYGGYAALCGAAFTPDTFCCAVDYVGVSNLLTVLRTLPPYWSLAQWEKRVGSLENEEFLKSRSPVYHADKIKIPVLIAHGANDVRVKQSESEQIVAALKNKGLPVEYLLFHDEGHGFQQPENRLIFYTAVEKFLAQHLGDHCG